MRLKYLIIPSCTNCNSCSLSTSTTVPLKYKKIVYFSCIDVQKNNKQWSHSSTWKDFRCSIMASVSSSSHLNSNTLLVIWCKSSMFIYGQCVVTKIYSNQNYHSQLSRQAFISSTKLSSSFVMSSIHFIHKTIIIFHVKH